MLSFLLMITCVCVSGCLTVTNTVCLMCNTMMPEIGLMEVNKVFKERITFIKVNVLVPSISV